MRLNKINLLVLAAIVIIGELGIHFYSFRYVSNTLVKPQITEPLDTAGNKVEFTFSAKSSVISGIMMKFNKNFYIPNTDQKDIALVVNYQDLAGQVREYQKTIPINAIKPGNQEIALPNIKVAKGKTVTVDFIAQSDIEPKKSLSIVNQDYDPDPDLNTAPRVIYKTSIDELLQKGLQNLNQDRGFSYVYGLLIKILAFVIIVFILFRHEEKAQTPEAAK